MEGGCDRREGEGELEGRERGTEGCREGETKGGSVLQREGGCDRREGERGGRKGERRKEVWRVKRTEGVGRVLQREGGCGRREDGVEEGGKGERGGIGYGG